MKPNKAIQDKTCVNQNQNPSNELKDLYNNAMGHIKEQNKYVLAIAIFLAIFWFLGLFFSNFSCNQTITENTEHSVPIIVSKVQELIILFITILITIIFHKGIKKKFQ